MTQTNSKQFHAAEVKETERMPFARQKATKRNTKRCFSRIEKTPFTGRKNDFHDMPGALSQIRCHPPAQRRGKTHTALGRFGNDDGAAILVRLLTAWHAEGVRQRDDWRMGNVKAGPPDASDSPAREFI